MPCVKLASPLEVSSHSTPADSECIPMDVIRRMNSRLSRGQISTNLLDRSSLPSKCIIIQRQHTQITIRPQGVLARAWGSPFSSDPSDKQPSNSREDDVLALEKALARLPPSFSSPFPDSHHPSPKLPPPNTSPALSSDYPVWLGKSAMLPGFWDILGVHQPHLVAMMEMILEGGPPYFYVHMSRSSSLPPKPSVSPSSLPASSGEKLDHGLGIRSDEVGHDDNIDKEEDQGSGRGSGALSDDEGSWILPSFDHDRSSIGTLMEVMMVDRTLGGRRLFLAVRALARVRLTEVTQTLPHPRATIEWEPDEEEVEAALSLSPSDDSHEGASWHEAKKAAAASGFIWSRKYEVAPRADELSRLSPLSTHIVDLARSFHELSPPSGEVKEVAEEAALAALATSLPPHIPPPLAPLKDPSQPFHTASSPHASSSSLEETSKLVWELIREIKALQAALTPPPLPPSPPPPPSSLGLPPHQLHDTERLGDRQEAPAPVVARALRPILSKEVTRALAPLLELPAPSSPSSSLSLWPPHRRARWFSFALAAVLEEEVSRGAGRQALLEASGAKERLEMALEILRTKKERLQTLLALKGLSSHNKMGGPEGQGTESVSEDEQGGAARAGGERSSLEAAAMLERLFSSPSTSPSTSPSPFSQAPTLNTKLGPNLSPFSKSSTTSAMSGRKPIDRLSLEKKRLIKRKMQERALRRAARCQQGLGAEDKEGDEGDEEEDEAPRGEVDEEECEALWQEVKDLASMPSVDIDDPPATA